MEPVENWVLRPAKNPLWIGADIAEVTCARSVIMYIRRIGLIHTPALYAILYAQLSEQNCESASAYIQCISCTKFEAIERVHYAGVAAEDWWDWFKERIKNIAIAGGHF